MTSSPSNEETLVDGQSAGARPAATKRLSKGDVVGRYMILDRVGSGGMGVVYGAYDPELDRKLALKLLHQGRGADSSTEGRARLQREARAMAKIQHHNVITVHDVGEHEGQVFVAMEFVEGQTLKAWARTAPRAWREVIEVFRKAGRGLAAAHRKGLVHRDFKPDNVMLGTDGRVRVLDFGLARGQGDIGDGAVVTAAMDVLSSELTAAGSVVGTPAYMSPEQHACQEVDAASDQFSFCVALYECLYGERPFEGDSPVALSVSVTEGRLREAPTGSKVPGWIRTILVRGLATDPGQRFASMDDLLRGLERDPTRRRWQLGAALGVAVVAGGLYGGDRIADSRRVAACQASGEGIAQVWNPSVRASLSDAMNVREVGYGEVAFGHMATWLDRHAAAWAGTQTQHCLAVSATRSVESGDAGAACLQDRRDEMEQLLAVLADEGAAALPTAIQAAASLSPASRCVDAQWLARHHALPSDAAVRASVGEVRRLLTRARILGELGKETMAVERAREAVLAAESTGWLPIQAEARLGLGGALQGNNEAEAAKGELIAAFLLATEAGDTVTAVRASGLTAFVSGYDLRDALGGELWSDISGALLRSTELTDDLVGAAWRQSVAATHYAGGDYASMRDLYREAEAIRSRLLGPEHPDTLSSRASVATALVQLGEFQDARDILEPTIESLAHTLGPDHPHLSPSLGTLARVCQRLGDDEGARKNTRRALEIARGAFGSDHVATARAMVNHANTTDDEEERVRLYEGALPALEASLGAQHPMVAGVVNNVALSRQREGDLEEAARLLERSLAAHEKNPGREHPKTAMIVVNLGRLHMDAKRPGKAAELFEEALAVQRKMLGEDHPDTAHTSFLLATALWERGTGAADRGRARTLAAGARPSLAGKVPAETLAEVDEWLAEHT